MSLVPVDTSSELAVTSYLQQARDWLAQAVETTGPEQIANAKAEIATAAEATKQLGLSKDIRMDAQEMVRRAEFALGKAIRKGQIEGTVFKQGERSDLVDNKVSKSSVYDFATVDELSGNGAGIYHLSDNVQPEAFDAAIVEARAEGNLSRANVARKVKKPNTRDQRADLIAELAAQGYSSRQMPSKVGVSEEWVRQLARDYGIEIPADRSVGRTRRINSTQVVVNTATALEGLLAGIELVEFDDLDLEETGQWAASLTDSTKKLARFAQQIRKATQ